MQDGKVIAYASNQVKPYAKNYPNYDQELVAVVFALKMWIHYLYGSPCNIFTNHKKSQIHLHSKRIKFKAMQWLALLKDYDLQITTYERLMLWLMP